jgi:hypothetical protein
VVYSRDVDDTADMWWSGGGEPRIRTMIGSESIQRTVHHLSFSFHRHASHQPSQLYYSYVGCFTTPIFPTKESSQIP